MFDHPDARATSGYRVERRETGERMYVWPIGPDGQAMVVTESPAGEPISTWCDRPVPIRPMDDATVEILERVWAAILQRLRCDRRERGAA